MPPGKEYMAEGTTCSWVDWIKTWSDITGVPASYRQITPDEMIELTPDRDCGIEVAYMFSYSTDPGYDGGRALLTAADIRKANWYRLPDDELERVGKPPRLVRRVKQG
ncbi:uncharacterized protein N7529_010702 [Penicillium soppii]|uniref:uncharacterized protein n=1 Tax=Penicillium soppii TaxID=69789 RepID=UPI002546AFA0|nr:uncharacterized protein N7529_010702 [Penicillium soppii]KAJ5851317.1 hypothetical protein N7529_010702 [Penicillium soppii]